MMQQEISQQISERLRLKLSETEQQKMMAKRNPTNAEAYQFYLKVDTFGTNDPGRIQKSNRAVSAGNRSRPNLCTAFTGLADCYSLLEQYAGVPSSETTPKARTAAERALQLDDSLAEAHTSLARCTRRYGNGQEQKTSTSGP